MKLTKILLSTLTVTITLYLIGSFIELSLNIINWSRNTREGLSIALPIVVVFYMVLNGILDTTSDCSTTTPDKGRSKQKVSKL